MKYLWLHLALLFYSCSLIFSKKAALAPFLSREFFLMYAIVLAILAIYALAWQQILKVMPLTTAFFNKAVTIVWGIILGKVFFDEQITVRMLIGAAIVFVGICVVISSEKEPASPDAATAHAPSGLPEAPGTSATRGTPDTPGVPIPKAARNTPSSREGEP